MALAACVGVGERCWWWCVLGVERGAVPGARARTPRRRVSGR